MTYTIYEELLLLLSWGWIIEIEKKSAKAVAELDTAETNAAFDFLLWKINLYRLRLERLYNTVAEIERNARERRMF